jgi:hypothetical protein
MSSNDRPGCRRRSSSRRGPTHGSGTRAGPGRRDNPGTTCWHVTVWACAGLAQTSAVPMTIRARSARMARPHIAARCERSASHFAISALNSASRLSKGNLESSGKRYPTSLSQCCNSVVQNSNPPTSSGLTSWPSRLVASNVNLDPSSSSIG